MKPQGKSLQKKRGCNSFLILGSISCRDITLMSRHKNRSVQSATENRVSKEVATYSLIEALAKELNLRHFKKSRVRNDVATTHSGCDLKKS